MKQALRTDVFPSTVRSSPLRRFSRQLRPTKPDDRARFSFFACVAGLLLFFTGCTTPTRTYLDPKGVVLPARIVSNYFIVEPRGRDDRTYRFIIDTGSTISYASPDLARRFGEKPKKGEAARISVRSASGGEIELEPVTLRQVALGDLVLTHVPAVVFDLTELSNHLGLQIDGIIGFPVFRNLLLTMDYPESRLIILPSPVFPPPLKPAPHASTIPFNGEQNTPLIPVQMGNESFVALVDTGSDLSLSLNPTGLHPRYLNGPRPGTLISSLQGDRRQLTGRLSQNVLVGTQVVEHPIVDLSDQLSSLGGEFLKNFSITFDERHKQVTFTRLNDGPVTMPPRRSTGLAFSRSPVYWRVLTVIPDSPAASLPVQAGDLCIRINGELVNQWGFDRYAALVQSAARITYTFINGTKESDLEVPVFELVP